MGILMGKLKTLVVLLMLVLQMVPTHARATYPSILDHNAFVRLSPADQRTWVRQMMWAMVEIEEGIHQLRKQSKKTSATEATLNKLITLREALGKLLNHLTFPSAIAQAAAPATCLYGGWTSQYANTYCRRPSANGAYQVAAKLCPKEKSFPCNPNLYGTQVNSGKPLCVDITGTNGVGDQNASLACVLEFEKDTDTIDQRLSALLSRLNSVDPQVVGDFDFISRTIINTCVCQEGSSIGEPLIAPGYANYMQQHRTCHALVAQMDLLVNNEKTRIESCNLIKADVYDVSALKSSMHGIVDYITKLKGQYSINGQSYEEVLRQHRDPQRLKNEDGFDVYRTDYTLKCQPQTDRIVITADSKVPECSIAIDPDKLKQGTLAASIVFTSQPQLAHSTSIDWAIGDTKIDSHGESLTQPFDGKAFTLRAHAKFTATDRDRASQDDEFDCTSAPVTPPAPVEVAKDPTCTITGSIDDGKLTAALTLDPVQQDKPSVQWSLSGQSLFPTVPSFSGWPVPKEAASPNMLAASVQLGEKAIICAPVDVTPETPAAPAQAAAPELPECTMTMTPSGTGDWTFEVKTKDGKELSDGISIKWDKLPQDKEEKAKDDGVAGISDVSVTGEDEVDDPTSVTRHYAQGQSPQVSASITNADGKSQTCTTKKINGKNEQLAPQNMGPGYTPADYDGGVGAKAGVQ